jgi:hypothetical protein
MVRRPIEQQQLTRMAPPGAGKKNPVVVPPAFAGADGGVCDDCRQHSDVRWRRPTKATPALCSDCAHWAWGNHSPEAKKRHLEKRNERLRDLFLLGASWDRLAIEAGRSKETVRRLPEIEIANKFKREARWWLAVVYVGIGRPTSEIAARLGLSQRSIQLIAKEPEKVSTYAAGVAVGRMIADAPAEDTETLLQAINDNADRLPFVLDLLETWVLTGSVYGTSPPTPSLELVAAPA